MKHVQGFEEFEHTADWGIQVWATTLDGLLESAARGMLDLLDVELDPTRSENHILSLPLDLEPEVLLVSFLEEVLFLSETQRVAFDEFVFVWTGRNLQVALSGVGFFLQRKEIKAITFHNLSIKFNGQYLEAAIVFDL